MTTRLGLTEEQETCLTLQEHDDDDDEVGISTSKPAGVAAVTGRSLSPIPFHLGHRYAKAKLADS
jgi:hypothetical protein